jgi:hypothetical protein
MILEKRKMDSLPLFFESMMKEKLTTFDFILICDTLGIDYINDC